MLTGPPFQSTWSWALIDTTFFTGSTGGGGWFGWLTGRSSFTAWVCGGMVTISMISSTSMTSISGVVLMSIIGVPSTLLPVVCIAMSLSSYLSLVATAQCHAAAS